MSTPSSRLRQCENCAMLSKPIHDPAWGPCCPGCLVPFKFKRSGVKPGPGPKARRRLRIIKQQGAVCVACGATDGLTIDHIMPRSKGGSDAISNLQVMCFRCNSTKGDTLPDAATG